MEKLSIRDSTYDTLNRLASSTVTQTAIPTRITAGVRRFGNRTIRLPRMRPSQPDHPRVRRNRAQPWQYLGELQFEQPVVGTAMAPNGLGYDAPGRDYDGVNSYLYDGEAASALSQARCAA